MKAIALDFEATDATEDAQATEIGIMGVDFYDGILDKSDDQKDVTSKRCKPDRPISFGAMAVTNIFTEDLQHCDGHTVICAQMMPQGAAYIIGHNIDFDIRVAANAGVDVSQYKAICTLAMARNLYPDADSHTLGAMSCMLDYEYARANMKDAHGAAADVVMTARLLYIICKNQNIASMDQLYEFSEEARIPLTFTFGKHQGKTIKDIAVTDRGYLQWIIKNHDNAYLVKACLDAITGNININV